MKTLKIFFLFAFAATLVSCSSDDDNSYEFNKGNLSGIYNLKSLKSKEVKKVKVEGFDVVTTTTTQSDTESFTYEFTSNNKLTKDGSYRITMTKTQGGNKTDSTYIVHQDQVKVPYTINEIDREITIDDAVYEVSDFNVDGLRLKLKQKETLPDGGTREYTEEIKLIK